MRLIDLSGQHFGRLVVLRQAEVDTSHGRSKWVCRCDCSSECTVLGQSLRDGRTHSCGCYCRERSKELLIRYRRPRMPIDMSGRRYGRLTVLRLADDVNHGHHVVWMCRCDCGVECNVSGDVLRRGESRSCGCLRRELTIARNLPRHGEARDGNHTAEYRAWQSMLNRCYGTDSQHRMYYRDRGIIVCEHWRASYEAFLADVGRKPSSKHSLDRWPNNDGNYESGNVRWATPTEQAQNRRPPHARQVY